MSDDSWKIEGAQRVSFDAKELVVAARDDADALNSNGDPIFLKRS